MNVEKSMNLKSKAMRKIIHGESTVYLYADDEKDRVGEDELENKLNNKIELLENLMCKSPSSLPQPKKRLLDTILE